MLRSVLRLRLRLRVESTRTLRSLSSCSLPSLDGASPSSRLSCGSMLRAFSSSASATSSASSPAANAFSSTGPTPSWVPSDGQVGTETRYNRLIEAMLTAEDPSDVPEEGYPSPVHQVSDGPSRELLINNPAKDNDLSLEMIDFMSRCLRGGERNKNMYSHMMTSCKASDTFVIRPDWADVMAVDPAALTDRQKLGLEPAPLDISVAAKRKQYYTELYSLAHLTADLTRPFFPVLNGKIGGPGAALAFNSTRAIATERTVFRANYAQHGWFPDCGMSRVLSRLPGNWGLYLALTGERVCGFELVRVGLVSHYMSTGNLQWVRRVLADQHEAQGAIDALQNVTSLDTIELIKQKPTPLETARAQVVEECFGLGSLEEVVAALEKAAADHDSDAHRAEVARGALSGISAADPVALRMTWALISQGVQSTLKESIELEYRAMLNMMERSDYDVGMHLLHERASDSKSPKWSVESIAEVSEEEVEEMLLLPPNQGEIDLSITGTADIPEFHAVDIAADLPPSTNTVNRTKNMIKVDAQRDMHHNVGKKRRRK